jgi:hypothetical protein
MASRRSHFQSTLRVLPAFYVFKIELIGRPGIPYRIRTGPKNRQVGAALKKFDNLR